MSVAHITALPHGGLPARLVRPVGSTGPATTTPSASSIPTVGSWSGSLWRTTVGLRERGGLGGAVDGWER
jgi:hypothetical protein